ncbi:hypothetical protein QQS21_004471 [Conoideocrella luteorostrata]|uniref:GH16 domain-containing protein n=1 Tax=Conoideocrella luteorostrata TaxID=1105319 RepID=A0AAJ0CVF4_9HYPO|nr:hypothetical protein QQS21_004471 [Conoideocrella luteorostrata]
MRLSYHLSSVLLLSGSTAVGSVPTTLIPNNSFQHFSTYWKDLYPWGTDHNGGARMDKAHISVNSSGVLTLRAQHVTGQPPAHQGGKTIPINYLSGTVYAAQNFTIKKGGGLDFEAEIIAPVRKGTWPAFWLTSANSWPPEIDIGEWKGTGKISFNTFNTSSVVKALDVNYPDPTVWHSIKCQVRDENGRDVAVKFYLDDNLVTTQYGSQYIGRPLYL